LINAPTGEHRCTAPQNASNRSALPSFTAVMKACCRTGPAAGAASNLHYQSDHLLQLRDYL
jgi:hypothetical protein